MISAIFVSLAVLGAMLSTYLMLRAQQSEQRLAVAPPPRRRRPGVDYNRIATLERAVAVPIEDVIRAAERRAEQPPPMVLQPGGVVIRTLDGQECVMERIRG